MNRPEKLDPPVDVNRDHVLGPPDAELTLVEYGSYACRQCHAVHDVIEILRVRFGDRMRYVFRHLPVAGSGEAARAAELTEHAAARGQFWEVHEALMECGPALSAGDIERIAGEFNLPTVTAPTNAHELVREGVADAAQRGFGVADVLHQRPAEQGRLGRKLACGCDA